ncbi:hypothetical protein GEV33_004345 [Tenebrio molitor]|uniref:Transposase n=1 Tax=Tenebrio molitor TaxID=7067 RepID=A0A8J6HNC5_TENMO|nr:hypothetical protein GEV33_004345 [Tenebrio molitor]
MISAPTVRRRLKERGLSAKTPATGPRLTVGHRRARLEFAHQYVNWGDNEWKNVLFTEAHTDLVFVENGAMTAHRYILECVESHVVPYVPFIGENFLFMDDNARPHKARIVVRYLEQVGIRLLPWPANSPDLNPIEHVWDFLGKRVRRRQLRPETLNGLRVALEEECAQIPQNYIATLIQIEFFVVNVIAKNVQARRRVVGSCPINLETQIANMKEGGLFAKQLVRRLDARKPRGTNLMKPAIGLIIPDNDGPCYALTYGVLCECEHIQMPYFGVDDDGPVHINEINVGE